ncbi:MerR family transcriptional regulator [Thermodesulfobacteriota bacterium]
MPERIYDKTEFMATTGLDENTLDTLVEKQVLRPAGRVDGERPYFDEQGAEAAGAVVKLLEIGYGLEEVIRIRSKVGLPKKKGARTVKEKSLLTVGELAKRIGSNARTIKHWEEKGIIEPDSYSPGGFRIYGEHYVKLCLLIQDLQLFGYSLDEIKVVADFFRDFLAIKDRPGDFSPEVLMEKVGRIREQITGLNEKMGLFEKGVERWRGLLKQKQKELTAMTARIRKQQRRNRKEPSKPGGAGKGAGQKKPAKGKGKQKG